MHEANVMKQVRKASYLTGNLGIALSFGGRLSSKEVGILIEQLLNKTVK